MATLSPPNSNTESSSKTSSNVGSLFFFDARSCKEWLKAIALTNIAQAQQKLLDALRMLNADSHFLPLERLTAMELMRDKLSFLLSEQRARYVNKTVPLSNIDLAAWHTSTQLISEMETGYRRCYQHVGEADDSLSPHIALIIQRTIRYIGLGMLMSGFIYRAFDGNAWMRLHLQYIEAETRGLALTRVKDSIGTAEGYSSIEQAYVAVLLGQLADIYSLSAREVEFTDQVLKRFSHKVNIDHPNNATVATTGPALKVDLLAPSGALCEFENQRTDQRTDKRGEQRNEQHGGMPQANMRVLNMADFSKSLRRRIRKLNQGEAAATLDLPGDWSAADAEALLTALHSRWCEPLSAQALSSIPAEHNAIVAFGIAETHYFLSGDIFEQPDVKREMSRQETNDIAMFGRVSESTTRARYAEFNYGSETWVVVDESRCELRLIRPSNSARGLGIGRLLGVRISNTAEANIACNDFYLGVVSRLVEDAPNQFTVTLTMLPGKPEAVAVRSADNKARTNIYSQGFRLPPTVGLNIPETLIVPSNLAALSRGIDIFHQAHGSAKQVNVLQFLTRGEDFDRITISG